MLEYLRKENTGGSDGGCEKQAQEPMCPVQSRAGLDAVLPFQGAQTHLLLYFL